MLDPPIGTVYLARGSQPAVAFEAVRRRYLVVWHAQLSNDTSEIRAQRLDDNGDLVSSIIRIESDQGQQQANPTVATVGGSDRFCVVWQSAPSAVGPWELRCRLMSSETGALSNTVVVAPTQAHSDSSPDLGSEASTADEEVVLVWERSDRGVMAAQITVPPTGDPNAFGEIRLASGRRPRISQSGGSSGTYVVAYESGTGIRAIPIDRNLGVLDPSLSMTGTESGTDVDGDGQDFVVVYQREESVGAGVHDIIGRVVRWDGAQFTATTAELPIAAEPGRDERDPAVGSLGSRVLTAWSRATGDVFDYEARMRKFTLELGPCGPVHDATSALDVIDAAPAIGIQLASGGTPREAVVAYSRFSSRSQRLDVRMQRFTAFAGGPTRSLSPACGLGGTVAANGPFAMQFVTLGTAATPCTIVPGLSASNRMLATLDY